MPTDTDDLLLPKEAAALLKVSRPTLQRLVDLEGLPAIVLTVGPKGHRALRFRRAEVQEWMNGRCARRTADWTRHEKKGAT